MERWCWKIECPTCGHAYFRLAFREILRGNHPDSLDWSVSGYCLHGLMEFDSDPLPRIGQWPVPHQNALARILANASLGWIAKNASYPDWIGFLGLGLFYCEDAEREERMLTCAWVPQLLEMLPSDAPSRIWLEKLSVPGSQDVLNWQHLGAFEHDMIGAAGRLSGTF